MSGEWCNRVMDEQGTGGQRRDYGPSLIRIPFKILFSL